MALSAAALGVERTVCTMYGGGGGAREQQAAAVQWLLGFADSNVRRR